MEKSKIFIASSSAAGELAEKLRDELQTDYCEARLRKQEIALQPGATTIEILERASATYDFAVIILVNSDVVVKEEGKTQQSRDNCVFEAGLFIASLGRERCFLVTSVAQNDLPPDLDGINPQSFTEPPDLSDRQACARAIGSVTPVLKDRVQFLGRVQKRPLSQDDLLARERPKGSAAGGELHEDHVVVTAIQPLELTYEAALQVKSNIAKGIRYVYFFHGDTDGALKVSQLLQMLLLAPMLDRAEAKDFTARARKIQEQAIRTSILADLAQLCAQRSLMIYFLPAAPTLQFCIHNAANVDDAVLYFKRRDKLFIQWEKGRDAQLFWKEVRDKYRVGSDKSCAIIRGAPGFAVKEGPISEDLASYLESHFPGTYEQVRQLCMDGKLG